MDSAVKGLAVLTAIPVVILAIWADYYGRQLETLAKENPHYDPAVEQNKIRLVGIFAIFFQFGIFVGTSPVRDEAPLLANLIFALGVISQTVIQAGVERKLRKPKPSFRDATAQSDAAEGTRSKSASGLLENLGAPKPTRGEPAQEMELAMRAFFWATVGGALYLLGFAVPVIAASFIAKLVHASPTIVTTVVIVSAIGGMITGVAINFALGAFYLRRMLPAQPLPEGDLRIRIESCFKEAGLLPPTLWVVETGRRHEATAMLAGFPNGHGFLRPGLFLSRGLLESLNFDEVRAVILHEVSHLRLQHLCKRMFYSAALVVTTTIVATFCVFLASVLLTSDDARNAVSIAAAAGAFVLTFKLLSDQSRGHELQADAYSVAEFGMDLADLASALRKLDRVNGRAGASKSVSHPATERRIEALQRRFGTPTEIRPTHAAPTHAKSSDSDDIDRAA